MAARCAGDQHAYWPMHDRLFNAGRKFDLFSLQEIAKDLDLDMDQFTECMILHVNLHMLLAFITDIAQFKYQTTFLHSLENNTLKD